MNSILNHFTNDMLIKNVHGSVDENNKVTVLWDWPQNTDFGFCFVYLIKEDVSLETLIAQEYPKTIYESQFAIKHTAVIGDKSLRFKIFAARALPYGGYEIVNQSSDNCSELFVKRIDLHYSIEYSKKLFTEYQTAILNFKNLYEVCDDMISYTCIGGKREHIKYPIDLKKFGKESSFEVCIFKNEKLKLNLEDKQMNYIKLIYD